MLFFIPFVLFWVYFPSSVRSMVLRLREVYYYHQTTAENKSRKKGIKTNEFHRQKKSETPLTAVDLLINWLLDSFESFVLCSSDGMYLRWIWKWNKEKNATCWNWFIKPLFICVEFCCFVSHTRRTHMIIRSARTSRLFFAFFFIVSSI